MAEAADSAASAANLCCRADSASESETRSLVALHLINRHGLILFLGLLSTDATQQKHSDSAKEVLGLEARPANLNLKI